MKDKFSFLKSKILSGKVYPEFFEINNESVINLGCGEGPQAIVYAGGYKKMVGVDINKERLQKSKEAMKLFGVKNYKTLYSNVEKIHLSNSSFDKALAIDIIEHVQNPKKLCLEINRLLKKDGELLITFPAMHDIFTDFVSKLSKLILMRKKKVKVPNKWNPDEHNQEYPLKVWIKLVEDSGFKLRKSRATTLFPPLHLYGIPKFWFKIKLIHRIDSFFCKLPGFKNLGQALLCNFKKNN